MNWYYDTTNYYAYICLSGCDREFVQRLSRQLEGAGIAVLRLYENPTFPAADGVQYEKLIRIGFEDQDDRSKYEEETIDRVIRLAERRPNESPIGDRGEDREGQRYETLVNNYSTVVRESIRSVEERVSAEVAKAALTYLNETADIRAALDIQNAELQDLKLRLRSNGENGDSEVQEALLKKIGKREDELKRRLGELDARAKSLDDREMRLDERQQAIDKQREELFSQIREHSLGMVPVEASENLVRVLVFGASSLSGPEVQQCVATAWEVRGDVDDIDVEAIVSEDDKALKSSSVVEKLKNGAYDYLLCGPHPHNINGKNGRKGWQSQCEAWSLNTVVFSNFNTAISKAMLESWVGELLKHRGKHCLQGGHSGRALPVSADAVHA